MSYFIENMIYDTIEKSVKDGISRFILFPLSEGREEALGVLENFGLKYIDIYTGDPAKDVGLFEETIRNTDYSDFRVLLCNLSDEIYEQTAELCKELTGDDARIIDIYKVYREKIDEENRLLNIFEAAGREQTSISDDVQYPLFCKVAGSNDDVFSEFRRSMVYNIVLEHTTLEDGARYLKEIPDSFTSAEWSRFLENDMYGNPRRFRYKLGDELRMASPTTLRYVKIFHDICEMFDMSRVKRISEIGVGYGGQCRILSSECATDDYYLIDIPEALMVARAYLEKYPLTCMRYTDGTTLDKDIETDLFISNYAFSELRRDIQELYMNHVVRHAPRGYILYNVLSNQSFGGYTAQEIADRFKDARILEEKPLTYAGNCLIVWGAGLTEH